MAVNPKRAASFNRLYRAGFANMLGDWGKRLGHEGVSMQHRGVRAGQGRGRVIYYCAGSTMILPRPRLIR